MRSLQDYIAGICRDIGKGFGDLNCKKEKTRKMNKRSEINYEGGENKINLENTRLPKHSCFSYLYSTPETNSI